MKRLFQLSLTALVAIVFVPRVFADASIDINSLAESLIANYEKRKYAFEPKKIAILNFDELGTNVKKNQLGQVVSGLLLEKFSNYPMLKVVEREKLDLLFKELNLNLSGAVKKQDIKRVGLILGIDFLLLGSVVEIENQFLIHSRIVNVETGEIIAAKSATIDKSTLIDKSVEYNYLRKLSGASLILGRISFGDLAFKKDGMGAELYYILPSHNVVTFKIFKSLGKNTNMFFNQQIKVISPLNYSFYLGVNETNNSLFSALIKYKFLRPFSPKIRIYIDTGIGICQLNSQQYFFNVKTPNSTPGGLNLPIITEQTYTALGLNAGIGFQRYINPSLRFGMSYSLHYFSFRRELDPGTGNESLLPQIEHLNKRVNVFGNILNAQLTLSF